MTRSDLLNYIYTERDVEKDCSGVDSDGKDVIIANPWKFVEFILDKCSSNPNLLHSATAPLLPLYFVVEHKTQG